MKPAYREQTPHCRNVTKAPRCSRAICTVLVPLLMTVSGCAASAAARLDETTQPVDKLAAIELSVQMLEQERKRNQEEYTELRAQIADLQQKTLQLETDLDRIEKLVVARYEEYLKQDRQVLNELDQVLDVWLESIQDMESPDDSVAESSEQPARR